MSSPRIGRSVATEKNPLIRASNALGYAARKLREEAEEQETQETPKEVAARLRVLGNLFESREQERVNEGTREQIAALQPTLQPLIEKAREYIEDTIEAREEAKPLLDAIDTVDWPALLRGLADSHGATRGQRSPERLDENGEPIYGSDISASMFETDSTRHRINRMLAAVAELKMLVQPRSDHELVERLRGAEDAVRGFRAIIVRPGDHEAEAVDIDQKRALMYAVNSLQQGVSRGSLAEAIRGKLAGVERLFNEINRDLVQLDVEEAR